MITTWNPVSPHEKDPASSNVTQINVKVAVFDPAPSDVEVICRCLFIHVRGSRSLHILHLLTFN